MVWATEILVYMSTVVAAEPMEPPDAKSPRAKVLLTVEPLLVSVVPDPADAPIVIPPLNVFRPANDWADVLTSPTCVLLAVWR